MQVIPIQAIPNQSFNVVLDDQNCTLHLYQKGAFLYMDLAVEGVDVRTGYICLCNADLLEYPTPLFNGVLFFADMQGRGEPPSYEGLGSRFVLFFEAAEAEA